MKNTVKLLGIIALLAVIVLSIAACGSSAPAPAPAPTQNTTPEPAPAPPPPAPPPPAPAVQRYQDIIIDGAQNHTVVSKDTLSDLSRHFYKNGYYFPLIMLASRDVEDPDKIEPGMTLVIPNLQRNLDDATARAKIKSFLREISVLNNNRGRPLDAEGLRELSNSL